MSPYKLLAERFSAYGISVLILWQKTHRDSEQASSLGRTDYEDLWPSFPYPVKFKESHFHVMRDDGTESVWHGPPNRYYYLDPDTSRTTSFPDVEERFKFRGCEENCFYGED